MIIVKVKCWGTEHDIEYEAIDAILHDRLLFEVLDNSPDGRASIWVRGTRITRDVTCSSDLRRQVVQNATTLLIRRGS